MSDAARSQLEKDIERQQVEAQRFQQDAQAEINELQQQLQNQFQERLMPILEAVAKEKGLQMLLSHQDAGIVWWDPGIDLSAEVVKRLDAAPAK
jgi:Skp family chaperone for outer membrane proteins